MFDFVYVFVCLMYTVSFWTKVLIFLSSFASTMSIMFYTLLIFKDRCGFMYYRSFWSL